MSTLDPRGRERHRRLQGRGGSAIACRREGRGWVATVERESARGGAMTNVSLQRPRDGWWSSTRAGSGGVAPMRMGGGLLGQQKLGPRGDMGAHLKLGTLVKVLLELRFLSGHPYISYRSSSRNLLELL